MNILNNQFRINKTLLLFTVVTLSVFLYCSCSAAESATPEPVDPKDAVTSLSFTKTIPIGSNSWVIDNLAQDLAIISADGIHNWSSTDDVIRTYVNTGAGTLDVGFSAKSEDGTSKIKVTVGTITKEITLTSTEYTTIDVGSFTVPAGYNYIEIKGISKSGTYIGDINSLLLGGSAISSTLNFNPTTNQHFGRRGPSVHLNYNLPENKEIQYFYNEVTVPVGQDKLGSFFMVNGHAEGYFGLQVNSDTERRVLFSIWSAFSTDDPNQIPDDYKVTSLGHGAGVTVQDFGNEGSGIQSFKNVNWKAGVTYKLLLKAEPSTEVSGSTDYTGYFFNPDTAKWELIASLRRPKTSTYIKRPHSFLENFNPSTGYKTRQGEYGNQWAYSTDKIWTEVTTAKFTADATAAAGDRVDFSGGANGNKFFLKNCGFFNDTVTPGTTFTRTVSGTAPNINFSTLPIPTPPTTVTVSLIDRSNWSIKDFSTEEAVGEDGTNNGLASDVLDGDLATYWHSCWNGDCGTAAYPHHITIDMGTSTEIAGLQFNQRDNLSRTVSTISVSVSVDNTNWIALGDFNLANSTDNQNIDFENLQTTRYIKISMNSAHDNDRFGALAEIKGYTY
ncbi:DUF3472 domain-containing protein [Polaribacter sp. NJDZ03]|uniref:DUF3472 domain-containing protein n=1 Tax=Polaribacter sp. NJDZ03 TaxID=2855841 RepID=UPI001C4A66B6|nr:DUF3472 domain-containing protein [Polaribacter sp. NJDZ03]